MRRRLPLFRTVAVTSAVLLVGSVLVLFVARIDRVVLAEGRLAGGSLAVRTPVDGRVARVLVADGQRVAPGEPLVELDAQALLAERTLLEARLAQVEERRRARGAQLRRLQEDVHPAELEQAARAGERAALELDAAAKRLERLEHLGVDGLATELEIEQATLDRAIAELDRQEAERAVPALESVHRGRETALEAELLELDEELAGTRAERAELGRRIGQCTIASEIDGVVLGVEPGELVGRAVHEGDELLRLACTAADRFEGTVSDAGRAAARAGQRVHIRLAGYPWLVHGTVAGRVTLVSDRRSDQGGFATRIELDSGSGPGPLYEGMRGEARIVVEEAVPLGRLLVERLSRAAGP